MILPRLKPRFCFFIVGVIILIHTERIKILEDSIAQLELMKINLQKLYFTELDSSFNEYRGYPGAEVTWNGKVLKFVVPDYPACIREISNTLHKELKKKWIGYMAHAYYQTEYKIEFEKAMCVIVIYLPYSQPWDVDNRAISHILNSIRYLKLVKDDSSKYLAYTVIGRQSKDNFRTEIFVTDYENMQTKMDEIGIVFEYSPVQKSPK